MGRQKGDVEFAPYHAQWPASPCHVWCNHREHGDEVLVRLPGDHALCNFLTVSSHVSFQRHVKGNTGSYGLWDQRSLPTLKFRFNPLRALESFWWIQIWTLFHHVNKAMVLNIYVLHSGKLVLRVKSACHQCISALLKNFVPSLELSVFLSRAPNASIRKTKRLKPGTKSNSRFAPFADPYLNADTIRLTNWSGVGQGSDVGYRWYLSPMSLFELDVNVYLTMSQMSPALPLLRSWFLVFQVRTLQVIWEGELDDSMKMSISSNSL